MPQLTLHYFSARGLAEAIRLLLNYSNVVFEDKRYQMGGGFPKDEMPYGRLPVLDFHDGRKLPESLAILTYLARQHGLAGGDDDYTRAAVDSIAYLWQDFAKELIGYFVIVAGIRSGDKDKYYKESFLPALEKFGPIMERLLKDAGNGFYHKSGLTYVDFYGANFVLSAQKTTPDAIAKYPTLVQHCERVHKLPQLQTYLASRTDTPI